MNKQLATIATVLIGLAVLFSFLDKPDAKPEPPGPKANVTAQAKASVVQFAMEFGANCGEAAKKLKNQEFQRIDGSLDSDALWKWLAQENEKSRKDSFKGWGEMLDQAIKAGGDATIKALEDTHTGAGKVK